MKGPSAVETSNSMLSSAGRSPASWPPSACIHWTYSGRVIRTRLALRAYDINTYKNVTQEIFKHETIKGFYKGMKPNLAGILIYKGSSFFIYENLLTSIKQRQLLTKSFAQQFAASAIAATAGQFLTYPFDVIKRKYMVIKDREQQ